MAGIRGLDLSGYQPYKKMGRSCRLKDIADFNIHWPKLKTAVHLEHADLIMRYMCTKDIDEVVEHFAGAARR